MRAGEGTVYPLLGRLSARGWVRRLRRPAGGRVRFRYRLTPRGRAALIGMKASWDGLNRFVDRCLGGAYGEPNI